MHPITCEVTKSEMEGRRLPRPSQQLALGI